MRQGYQAMQYMMMQLIISTFAICQLFSVAKDRRPKIMDFFRRPHRCPPKIKLAHFQSKPSNPNTSPHSSSPLLFLLPSLTAALSSLDSPPRYASIAISSPPPPFPLPSAISSLDADPMWRRWRRSLTPIGNPCCFFTKS
jgi:hypothetical protein